MKLFRKILIVFILLIIIVWVIFNYRTLYKIISDAKIYISGILAVSLNYQEFLRIKSENTILKNELIEFKNQNCSFLISEKLSFREVSVYSNYPFNDRNSFAINFGRDDGAKLGMPVFAENNILLGLISNVQNTKSEVKTIFDTNWASSVIIGLEKTRAVLKGGMPPHLEFVPQGSQIKKGDMVVNASEDFPFGAIIGVISETEQGTGRFWHSVSIEPFFKTDDLRQVYVVINFP